MEYPWVVLHKNHIAFRMKDPEESKHESALFPDGTAPPAVSTVECGTCGKYMTPMGIVSGRWRVKYQMT